MKPTIKVPAGANAYYVWTKASVALRDAGLDKQAEIMNRTIKGSRIGINQKGRMLQLIGNYVDVVIEPNKEEQP